MRSVATLTVALLALGLPAGAAGQVDPDTLDLKAVFDAADSVAGVPVVDTLPELINCPRYDPSRVRGGAETFSFERQQQLEQHIGPVEFTLEFVVGKDGKVERRQVRVLRSNEHRLNRTFEFWVRTCAFKPGKIGPHEVRVRMVRTWRYDLFR